MILLTTSREPTPIIRTFCKDIADALPGMQRVSRGKSGLASVVKKAYELKKRWIVLVERWKGGPGRIRFIQIRSEGPQWIDPTILLRGVRLRKDYDKSRRRWGPAGEILFDDSDQISCVLADLMADITGLEASPIGSMVHSKTALVITRDQSSSGKMTIIRTDNFTELGPAVYIDRLLSSGEGERLIRIP